MEPTISIVTAAYNVASYIGPLIESIQAQTLAVWELVVVDDGSIDATVAVVERYAAADPRIRLVQQANSGPATARNRGLRLISASARYVTFMDSDDLWMPEALELLQAELERHPEAVGAHALADFIDGAGRPFRPGAFAQFGRRRFGFDGQKMVRRTTAEPTDFATVVWATPVYPPGVLLVQRRFYDQVGEFDSESEPGEDWDMLVRLSRFGELRFVNKVILLYRRHDANASRSVTRNASMVRYIHYKAFYSPENDAAQRTTVQRGWRAWQLFKIRESSAIIREYLRLGQPREALKTLSRLPVHALRFLRGTPSMSGI